MVEVTRLVPVCERLGTPYFGWLVDGQPLGAAAVEADLLALGKVRRLRAHHGRSERERTHPKTGRLFR